MSKCNKMLKKTTKKRLLKTICLAEQMWTEFRHFSFWMFSGFCFRLLLSHTRSKSTSKHSTFPLSSASTVYLHFSLSAPVYVCRRGQKILFYSCIFGNLLKKVQSVFNTFLVNKKRLFRAKMPQNAFI